MINKKPSRNNFHVVELSHEYRYCFTLSSKRYIKDTIEK